MPQRDAHVKLSGDDTATEGLPNGTQAPEPTSSCRHDFGVPSESSGSPIPVPVAICGMAMRLPGGISTEEQLWDFLVNKGDARDTIPADRYNVDGFFGGTKGKSNWSVPNDESKGGIPSSAGVPGMAYGYMLKDADLAHFDAPLFSMTQKELEWIDPQQRLLLEVTRECLENAGEVNWRGKDIGCYIGSWGDDWLELMSRDTLDSHVYKITGHADAMHSNRVSYEYDFKGPRTATESLLRQGVLSPQASCRTFDAEADGYARAEAVNMVYLKRLDDALRDKNPIRAVIRSTASNCDGKTAGISHPSSESHEALIRSCYLAGGIRDFTQTGFVECHGTGTRTGDPIETAAVANVFGGKGVYIGSVKPNLGHSEGASGLTSLMKCILALEHKTIPPNIKFSKPNSDIPFEQAGLRVPIENTPWPEDRRERVSINSFGIGGANAHVVLDSAESFGVGKHSRRGGPALRPRLLAFTANHVESVRKGASRYAQFLEANPEAIDDVSYTLDTRREHLSHRAFAVADGISSPEFSPPARIPARAPEVIFVFTGQGAQWATMGSQLVADFPAVLGDLDIMDQALSGLG
ncbi:Uu.00g109480.m01.CDS01 [Anthostomella pinea]|uniref:Uu.00g109480.m01.CDS01 n=1 Tax=Anthostomella pinea TaxID=933095 RepID=A0AAI8YG32_9PEZI|nr:Uu.00g109480.m01.CDS01 [Anthostomella pinea]